MDMVRVPAQRRDGRGEVRRRTSLCARMTTPDLGRLDVEVTDLSADGCCLRASPALRIGDSLTLLMPFLAPLASTVRWSDDDSVGIRFDRPLHQTVVDMLIGIRRH